MANSVFLAYANQNDPSLPALEQEFEQVRGLLMPLFAKDYIRLVPFGKITTDQLVQTLDTHRGQLSIFHFSGHAAGDRIELSDGAGFSDGLAQLLGSEPHLQLVFLNGCATKDQVAALLKHGVAAVIATAAPVEDQRAAFFAISFYRALVNKQTVLKAFQFARSELELRFRSVPDTQVRGLVLRQTVAEDEPLPWGLYLHPEKGAEAKHWRLPVARNRGLTDLVNSHIRERVTSNQFIVKVLDEMVKVNKDIQKNYLETYEEGQARAVDPSTYLDAVIQNFPWVIGSQIRLLRQELQPNQRRLQQLVSTYVLSSQLLYIILLSDCWEQQVEHGWEAPEEADFLGPPRLREELERLDFCRLLLATHDFIRAQTSEGPLSLFVPELDTFCRRLADPDHRLYKAYHYLEEIRQQLPVTSDLGKVCQRVEMALAAFLQEAAFLAGYHLLTVRNIYLENVRTQPVQYDLEMGRLNALASDSLQLYQDASNRLKDTYSHCKSVVLTPSERDLQFSLPLTPFLIDANTYLEKELPDLFLFAWMETGKYVYYSVRHDFYTALQGGTGFDLIDTEMTLEAFIEGENDQSKTDDFELDFGFSDAPTIGEETATKVFALLEAQHARFRSDFTPSDTSQP